VHYGNGYRFDKMWAIFLFGLMLLYSPSFADDSNMDGFWVSTDIRSTGISSDRAWEPAQQLLGQSITIENYVLMLPEGGRCPMMQQRPETLRNDMRTFGSFGGNWRQVGLIGDTNQFHVMVTELNCEDEKKRPFRIISQPDQNLHLLDFGRVFSALKRLEASQ